MFHSITEYETMHHIKDSYTNFFTAQYFYILLIQCATLV